MLVTTPEGMVRHGGRDNRVGGAPRFLVPVLEGGRNPKYSHRATAPGSRHSASPGKASLIAARAAARACGSEHVRLAITHEPWKDVWVHLQEPKAALTGFHVPAHEALTLMATRKPMA